MKSFLANSACNGRPPKNLRARKYRSRPKLVQRMMSERDVARFLVAPQGYGKTMLALEYASVVSNFANTFWVNCQSPCFLRDLDGGVVASTLSLLGGRGSLAIFEDVPFLGDGRAETFSRDIDTLLSDGWEVVVTATPVADSLGDLQKDRICIASKDLLIDADEIDSAGSAGFGDCDRIASFVWGTDRDADALLQGLKTAGTPAELTLVEFVMLVLGEGSIEEVLSIVKGMRKDTLRLLEECYPHLGIDLIEERFKARSMPIGKIAKACHASIGRTVEGATASNRDALVSRLADLLVRHGMWQRSCDLMATLCSRKKRAPWIENVQDDFVRAGFPACIQELFESSGLDGASLSSGMALAAARRLHLLQDSAKSAYFAARVLDRPDAATCQRIEAALLVDECAEGKQRRTAQLVLEGDARSGVAAQDSGLYCAARARLLEEKDLEGALGALESCSGESLQQQPVLLEVARAARLARDVESGRKRERDPKALHRRANALVARAIALCEKKSEPTVYEALLHEAVGFEAVSNANLSRRRKVERILSGLNAQREEARAKRVLSDLPPNVVPLRAASAQIPLLHVRLFGGMEVRMGGEVVDEKAFQKHKATTLLAILVLHRGKEVPRSELLDVLWPDTSSEKSVNSFYSLWSLLRRALVDERGTCPYLAKHQKSYMVDAHFVKSDVEEFESICRMLTFEEPEAETWMEAFARLEEDFACGLLPSESSNAYIARLRERFKTRLADVYVTAADRLCDVDEPRAALWFAQAALDRFEKREDAFCALMRAQMSTGQRSLAMDTFFECKRFMKEDLGMDPSERIMRLHRRLLDEANGGSLVSA